MKGSLKFGACALALTVFAITFTIYHLPFTISYADNSGTSVTVDLLECNDTLDNDSDLLVDYPFDLGCTSLNDNDETDPPVIYQCSDGLDNDRDSRHDLHMVIRTAQATFSD